MPNLTVFVNEDLDAELNCYVLQTFATNSQVCHLLPNDY